MIYGQEPDSEISNKTKVVFNLPNLKNQKKRVGVLCRGWLS